MFLHSIAKNQLFFQFGDTILIEIRQLAEIIYFPPKGKKALQIQLGAEGIRTVGEGRKVICFREGVERVLKNNSNIGIDIRDSIAGAES